MLSTLLVVLMTSTAFCMSLATNPLSLGLLILLTALTLSMTFATSMSSWVALLIFLIYVGGMLVMFSYFVSIIPNQTISSVIPLALLISMMLLSIGSFLFLSPPIFYTYLSQMNTLYNYKNIGMLLILALLLLFTMVIVVKISSSKKGALRSFAK